MKKTIPCLLKCELVKIPEGWESEDFYTFCKEHGVTAINSDRRGWYHELNLYIRGASHVIYWDGEAIGLIDQSDIDDGDVLLDGGEGDDCSNA